LLQPIGPAAARSAVQWAIEHDSARRSRRAVARCAVAGDTTMSTNSAGTAGGATIGAPIDLHESVAGEEDPGASIDLALGTDAPGRSDQPAGRRGDEPSGPQAPMRPGDEAPTGTPGTGETVCPRCGGSGQLGGGDCPECEGTGRINVGIGGA
jgi:hypothetical protein